MSNCDKLSKIVKVFTFFITLTFSMINNVRKIQTILDRLYPNPPIPLNYKCEFSFLCAVVLSAQTTDGKVNQVTDTLFKVAPTPQIMSQMNESDVLKIIQPVGLAQSKSRYLIGLSKMLVDRFNGEVPSSFEDLKSLPGVGHKTASVVRSQIFGHPTFAVDTHVHRLALRWKLSKNEKNPDQVQKDLCALFPMESWSKLHLQMIYFGREYCTAKLHINSECPICSWINSAPSDLVNKLSNSELDSSFISSTETQDSAAIYTPKKIPKGIISYASREIEVAQSPNLTPNFDFKNMPVSSSLIPVILSPSTAVDIKPIKAQAKEGKRKRKAIDKKDDEKRSDSSKVKGKLEIERKIADGDYDDDGDIPSLTVQTKKRGRPSKAAAISAEIKNDIKAEIKHDISNTRQK